MSWLITAPAHYANQDEQAAKVHHLAFDKLTPGQV